MRNSFSTSQRASIELAACKIIPSGGATDMRRESVDMQGKASENIAELLEEAERYAGDGRREHAYKSSLKATDLAPNEPRAWYLRSQSALSPEERLLCLSRVYSLDPSYASANGELHALLRKLLKQEPSLTYVHETPEMYQVRSGLDLLINVPKNRAYEELYPQRAESKLKPAYDWLNLLLLALFLGGVGAAILAPLAMLTILRCLRLPLSQPDRTRLMILLLLAMVIWLVSIPLGVLFAIHFVAWGS